MKPVWFIGLAVFVSGALLVKVFSAPKPIVKTVSSVPAILAQLPNLADFDIQECNLTYKKSTVGSPFPPAPSDTRMELLGKASLSKDGADLLHRRFKWTPVSRSQLPDTILDIAPPGDLLVSYELNDTFRSNCVYAHGFVVIPDGDSERNIYLLAVDMDHRIE